MVGAEARRARTMRAGDLSELLPAMMLGRLAAGLFEGQAAARHALGLITREETRLGGFGALTEAGWETPQRGLLAGGKPLIQDGPGMMDVRADGRLPSGKVRALRLPVAWRAAQLSAWEDRQGGGDKAAVIFLALVRCDPEEAGAAPVNRGLFGVYRFNGRAEQADRPGALKPNGQLRVRVIESAQEFIEAALELDNAARSAGSDFVRDCELTEALGEALNPAFYERRELMAATPGAAEPRSRPGL